MKDKKSAMLVLMTVVGIIISGCSTESARKDAAQRRWQQTIDQARLEAAQNSIDQGQLAYAERILKTCASDTAATAQDVDKVQQMLAQVEVAHRQFAKARQDVQDPEEQVY